jgi:ElaB/YqjD/DUF883 family membrane-anchored ribosome-binding protein
MVTAQSKTSTGPDREFVGQEITQELHQLRADIAALSGSLQRYGTLQAQELKARVKGMTDDTLDESLHNIQELRHKVDALQTRLQGDVRAHPLVSLAGALGLGLLFGLILARRD